jgi:hypothetical protein
LGILLEEIIVELLLASMDFLSDDAGILIFEALRTHLQIIFRLRVGEYSSAAVHPLATCSPRRPSLHYQYIINTEA